MTDSGEKLLTPIAGKFLWRVFPVPPTSEIFARDHLHVAPDLGGKLVD